MRTGKGRQTFGEINITPLTDIFLVLLIIMIVVAPMLDTQGLKVSVPSIGPAANTKDEPKTIDVSISAAGDYKVDGETVEKTFLANKFRDLKSKKPDGIVIKTNPEATHESLTFAMDAAQSAGVSKMAVTVDTPAGQ